MTNSNGLRVVSLFDGISCGMVALERANIPVKEYHAFEIDPYAIKISQKNYPNIIRHGSVIDADFSIFKDFDLVIGGSPCQSFSTSGKGLAFDDSRGKLFFEYIRALKEINPKYFLLENVLMKQEFQQVFDELMGVKPIMINSSLLSAQNRRRNYWTNIPNVTQPEDKNIRWGDVRERGVNDEKYYYTENGLQWLAKHSIRKNKKLKIHQDDEIMQMIEASHCKSYSSQRFFGVIDYPSDKQAVGAMRGRRLFNGQRQDNSDIKIQQMIEFKYDDKTNCLTTVQKDNVVVPFTLPNRIPVNDFFFRYLTPVECERLQTLPDNYTECVSKTQRYKSIGNGWTVDVIAHIFKGIEL